jgi:hypothetical protein
VRWWATTVTELTGEAREVALAEVQAVHALSNEAKYGDLVAQVDGGEVDDVELLEAVLELGLQSGRIRALYGPGGEQAAVATVRCLPRGRERGDSARDVTSALQALTGKTLEGVSVAAVGPAAFAITIDAGGVTASVRLDRSGARLTSVGL